MTTKEKDYVQAIFAFEGQSSADLTLQVGEIIRITEILDAQWARGHKLDQATEGVFPLNFVEPLKLPSYRTGQKIFVALQNFVAEQPGDLELTKGDIILGLEKVDDSWWKGKSGPLKGIFPVGFVIELEQNDGPRSRSASARSNSLQSRSNSIINQYGGTKLEETAFARALVDVKPQLDGELEFQLGDLVEITEIIDEDWMYGKCRNKEGLFSSVCVELLDDGDSGCESTVNCSFESKMPDRPHDFIRSDSTNSQTRPRTSTQGSYTSENTRSHDAEVTAYGQVLFPFVAQIPGELSLEEGQIVNLIHHVDSDWTNGEIDGRRGIFPSNFVEIIVDCPYKNENTLNDDTNRISDMEKLESESGREEYKENLSVSMNGTEKTPKVDSIGDGIQPSAISAVVSDVIVISANHEIGVVCHSFRAQVAEDISVTEGVTVEVIRRVDDNWVEIQLESGDKGLVPVNHIEIIGSWPRKDKKVSSKSDDCETFSNSTNDAMSRPLLSSKTAGQSSNSPRDLSGSQQTSLNSLEIDSSTHFIAHSQPPALPSSSPPVLPQDLPVSQNAQLTYTAATPKTATKPLIKPKPPIAVKPAIAPKPSVIKQSPFFTAKPFSTSTSRASHVVSPTEKRKYFMKSLDCLIEDEMVKAKSRSSTENSDSSNEHTGSVTGTQEADDVSCATFPSSSDSVTKTFEPEVIAMSSRDVTSWSQTFSGDSLLKKAELTVFDPVASQTESSPSSDTKSKRDLLRTCQSLPYDCDESNFFPVSKTKRASLAVMDTVSNTESKSLNEKALVDAKSNDSNDQMALSGTKETSFINKGFVMDVAEGNLIGSINNTKSVSSLSSRKPTRMPPPRPKSAIITSSSDALCLAETTAKCKPPPPHPTGPRVPPAPSKTPLVPIKSDPSQLKPKPVPQRPAPKAPVRTASHKNSSVEEKRISAEENPSSPSKKQIIPSRKAPPRPGMVSVPPSHSVPPQSGDLILLSPNKTTDENLLSLSGNEERNERSRLLAAQRAEEERRKKEEEIQLEVEQRVRRREHRNKIINEIMDTEKDYLFSLHLCLETFLDVEKQPPAGVDVEFILGNTEEIADVSQKILLNLESAVTGKAFEDQCIGTCFTETAEDMKNTYAPYCRNHDEVIKAFESYGDNEEIIEYFNYKVDKMKEQMNVFDASSLLIKPVQRILKYPLLLNELLQNTEDSHQDKHEIIAAIKAMTDVAKAINEYKRRKDLVYKYKKSSDERFSDKIAKLNLHSIKKKSTRMRGRLSTNLGLGLQLKDEGFEREEAKFRCLEKAVKTFLASTNKFLEHSQEAMRCSENLVDGIVQFYHDNECVEIEKFHQVNLKLLDLYVKMKETIEETVVIPLNTLVKLFNAPAQVIGKRFDKLLDYNHQLGKGGDNEKELKTTKNDYEAMNAQLMDELPKFYNISFNLLQHCMSAFVQARRDFKDQSLKESCALLELPSMISKDHMMEIFKIRHTTAFDHMSMLNFIPRGFNPKVDTVKADRARQRGKNAISDVAAPQALIQTSPGGQSDNQRSYLSQAYPSEKLYVVIATHNANDLMDISLTEGTVVGVVKELDPMGNKDRWFVDDGATKGFAPSNVLSKVTSLPLTSTSSMDEDILSIHSYDSTITDTTSIVGKMDDKLSFNSISNNGIESIPLETMEDTPIQDQQLEKTQQYYYALYDFLARHSNEASLTAGTPVKVVAFQDSDGNSEWWLVDSDGNRGYAPANYMAPMPYS